MGGGPCAPRPCSAVTVQKIALSKDSIRFSFHNRPDPRAVPADANCTDQSQWTIGHLADKVTTVPKDAAWPANYLSSWRGLTFERDTSASSSARANKVSAASLSVGISDTAASRKAASTFGAPNP